MALYENRVVAFIDILGWSELVKGAAQNEQLLTSIDSVASCISEISQSAAIINQVSKQISDDLKEKGFHFEDLESADLRSSHFSDTIVFSSPTNKAITGQLVSCVIGISVVLMRAGYYVRGAITQGSIHHTSHSLYGPALIKAYEIESKNAIYPRIILTEDILEYLLPEWIEKDIGDGLFFLNLFWHSKAGDIALIEAALTNNIQKHENNLSILQKLNWLKNIISSYKSSKPTEQSTQTIPT